MFTIYYSYLLSRIVVLFVVAVLVYFHFVTVLIISNWIVVLVILHEIAMMIILFRLPFTLSLLIFKHTLIAYRLLQLKVFFILILAKSLILSFKIGFWSHLAIFPVSVLESRLEFMASWR